MRKTLSILLSVAIFSMLFVSCEKMNIPSKTYSDSYITPEFETSCNDIFVVNSMLSTFSISSSIPVISARGDIDNYKLAFNPTPFTINETLGGDYKVEVLNQEDYTQDVQGFLIQNYEKNNIVNYYNYGYIEKEINFRVIGKLGARTLDFRDYESNDPEENYYISGIVVDIARSAKTGSAPYKTFSTHEAQFYKAYTKGGAYSDKDAASELWGGTLKEYLAFYDKEYIKLSIENQDGCFTFDVYGNKRDNDIDRLLKYVKPGYHVQVPANFKEIEDIKDKNFEEIKFNQVLVQIIPQDVK